MDPTPSRNPNGWTSRLRPGDAALVVAVAVYVLVRGAVLAASVPPWQGADEPGHAEYALRLASATATTAPDPRLEREILASMADHRFYHWLGIDTPDTAPGGFADVARLGGDPTQLDSETPVGYLPYALAAAGWQPGEVEAALGRMRAMSLLLVLVLVPAAAWAAAALGPGMAAPAAALVAAAPHLGFAGAVVNNDLTAALLACLWFGAAARAVRPTGTGRPVAGLAAAAAMVALALLAAAAKRTGLYLLPLTLLALVLAPAVRRVATGLACRSHRRRRRAWAAAAVAVVLVPAAVAWWPAADQASAWQRVGDPWGPTRRAPGRGAGHALAIVDRSDTAWQYLEQTVPAPAGARVEAVAWVRADRPTAVGLVVNDDAGTWLGTTGTAAAEWTALRVTGRLAPEARTARLAVYPGDGTERGTGELWVDDLRLSLDGRPALANGDAERPARRIVTVLAAAERYTDLARLAGSLPGAAASPGHTAARTWRGLFFLYRSFWGGFGWLTVWPGQRYDLVCGPLTLLLVGAAALALLAPRVLVRDGASAAALRLCGVGFVLAVAACLAGSMAGWGPDSLPQGRYLLSALAAVALPATALAERAAGRWGARLLAASALAVDAALVGMVIVPAFAGP